MFALYGVNQAKGPGLVTPAFLRLREKKKS